MDGIKVVLSPEEGVSCGSHELGSIVVKGCSLGEWWGVAERVWDEWSVLA
jgi:hypothetical protein